MSALWSSPTRSKHDHRNRRGECIGNCGGRRYTWSSRVEPSSRASCCGPATGLDDRFIHDERGRVGGCLVILVRQRRVVLAQPAALVGVGVRLGPAPRRLVSRNRSTMLLAQELSGRIMHSPSSNYSRRLVDG